MTNLFEYEDPVSYLQDVITANSTVRGFISKLAQAAGCQVSYFSQFLRHKNHLSPDHAAGLSDFLGHSNLESEYLLILLLLSRAATPKLKQKLEAKLKTLKLQHQSLSGRMEARNELGELSHRYYSSWLYAAVHMALAIPKYQDFQSLAKRFEISEEKARSLLSTLESMHIIYKKEGQWALKNESIHLPQSDELTFMNHFLWRQRALNDIDSGNNASVHYSSVFAVSEKDAKKLKSKILGYIESLRSEIQASPSEEVFCFNLDFFRA